MWSTLQAAGPKVDTADKASLEALLLQVAAANQDALALLYQRTRPAVYAAALSFLHSPQDAEDITQDTYVQVWDKAGQYRPQGSPMAWLLTITRNLAKMQLRTAGREVLRDEEEWNTIPAQLEGLEPEERLLLQTSLSTLTREERQVVLLHAVTGLKHRETAALLQLPLPTVLSKYHRALKKLKACLKGDDIP